MLTWLACFCRTAAKEPSPTPACSRPACPCLLQALPWSIASPLQLTTWQCPTIASLCQQVGFRFLGCATGIFAGRSWLPEPTAAVWQNGRRRGQQSQREPSQLPGQQESQRAHPAGERARAPCAEEERHAEQKDRAQVHVRKAAVYTLMLLRQLPIGLKALCFTLATAHSPLAMQDETIETGSEADSRQVRNAPVFPRDALRTGRWAPSWCRELPLLDALALRSHACKPKAPKHPYTHSY